MTNQDKKADLEAKLAEAIKRCDYWSSRRRGQVGNCISDQEHETDAWRDRQKYEYQLRLLEAV